MKREEFDKLVEEAEAKAEIKKEERRKRKEQKEKEPKVIKVKRVKPIIGNLQTALREARLV
jgi:hypothetical protein